MYTPKISIIVPIYNTTESELRECFRSIEAQTITDIEVIMVDDASTNNAADVCARQAADDRRFHLIRRTENQGVAASRNCGTDAATGEWVMYVDPDDTIAPEMCEDLLAATDPDVDIVGCPCRYISDGKAKDLHLFEGDRRFASAEEKMEILKQCKFVFPKGTIFTWAYQLGKIYRRSFLQKHGIRCNTRLRRWQDNPFVLHATILARSVVYLDKCHYMYRHVSKDLRQKYSEKELNEMKFALHRERNRLIRDFHLDKNSEFKQLHMNDLYILLWNMNFRLEKGSIISKVKAMRTIRRTAKDPLFAPLFDNVRLVLKSKYTMRRLPLYYLLKKF